MMYLVTFVILITIQKYPVTQLVELKQV